MWRLLLMTCMGRSNAKSRCSVIHEDRLEAGAVQGGGMLKER
ncbi:hypothetical protein FOFC_15819 [Fusarium oxysporum]|nr:hypothetical protein FOFC_15819 [Fusarium oxysporum]